MSLKIRFLLSMFAIFPAIVGLFKYKTIDKLFHPFIFMMWLAVPADTIDFLLNKFPAFKQIGYAFINIYTILNFFLFLLLSVNFGFLSKIKLKIFLVLAIIIGIVNLNLPHPSGILFYLLFFVSFIMLAISIDILTKQIMAIKQPLIHNFWFLMSSISIIYNAQLLIVFGTYFFAIHSKTLGNIFTLVNALCYILFGIATLKIPQVLKSKN